MDVIFGMLRVLTPFNLLYALREFEAFYNIHRPRRSLNSLIIVNAQVRCLGAAEERIPCRQSTARMLRSGRRQWPQR
jgi:hypothetical protein